MKKNVLITGVAGFIGFHVANKFLNKNFKVVGIDNISNYYDIFIKKKRLSLLKKHKNFKFINDNLLNLKKLINLGKKFKFDYIIHLAAQPGVQLSFSKPKVYVKNNIDTFINILELSKLFKPKHLVYASSSSVYGNNKKFPLDEESDTNKPISVYAVTKKSNELLAYVYSYNYLIPTTGIRFFTVYGPFGRPDMSILKFIDSIFKKKKIKLYNNGKNFRDFTFIDDVVERLYKVTLNKPVIKKNKNNLIFTPYRVINFSENKGITINEITYLIEKIMKTKSKKISLSALSGDVVKTKGKNKKLISIIKKIETTPYKIGIAKTIKWYLNNK